MFLFAFARTKIFIRFPRTLFATEDAFEFSKHQLGMIFVPLSRETNKLNPGEGEEKPGIWVSDVFKDLT